MSSEDKVLIKQQREIAYSGPLPPAIVAFSGLASTFYRQKTIQDPKVKTAAKSVKFLKTPHFNFGK
jgi:hypothetical protein